MRADGPIRSRRAIDSRSFSFDAGAKRWNASRSYSTWPFARIEIPIAWPPASRSIRRIHAAFGTASTRAGLEPVAFWSSWDGHVMRIVWRPRSGHVSQSCVAARDDASSVSVRTVRHADDPRSCSRTCVPLLAGFTVAVAVVHDPAGTDDRPSANVTAARTFPGLAGEVS